MNIDLNKATLVYTDESGQEHEQPVADITSSGTLIDPDTGDDMPLTGLRVCTSLDVAGLTQVIEMMSEDKSNDWSDEIAIIESVIDSH